MRELVIIGNGSYAQMMRRYIQLTDFGVTVAYAVDEEYRTKRELDNLPVITLKELKEKFPLEEISLIMGIGYTQMGNVRKRLFEECKRLGYCFSNYVHPTAIVQKNVTLGEGNNVLEGVILEESVIVGNANLFFGGSLVAHESTIGDYNTLSVKAVVAGCTLIGRNCFIGAAATVRDHVRINNYALIGAAAYADEDMEPYSVMVPAKGVVLEGRKSTEFL